MQWHLKKKVYMKVYWVLVADEAMVMVMFHFNAFFSFQIYSLKQFITWTTVCLKENPVSHWPYNITKEKPICFLSTKWYCHGNPVSHWPYNITKEKPICFLSTKWYRQGKTNLFHIDQMISPRKIQFILHWPSDRSNEKIWFVSCWPNDIYLSKEKLINNSFPSDTLPTPTHPIELKV